MAGDMYLGCYETNFVHPFYRMPPYDGKDKKGNKDRVSMVNCTFDLRLGNEYGFGFGVRMRGTYIEKNEISSLKKATDHTIGYSMNGCLPKWILEVTSYTYETEGTRHLACKIRVNGSGAPEYRRQAGLPVYLKENLKGKVPAGIQRGQL